MTILDELHSATIWSKEYDFGHSLSSIYLMLHHISLRSVQNILINVLMHDVQFRVWMSNGTSTIHHETGSGWFCRPLILFFFYWKSPVCHKKVRLKDHISFSKPNTSYTATWLFQKSHTPYFSKCEIQTDIWIRYAEAVTHLWHAYFWQLFF